MPSVSWRSDLARSRRLIASTSIPKVEQASSVIQIWPGSAEFRGQLVADVVGVGQLGDLPHVHDRLSEFDAGSVGEPQTVGVQDRGRCAAGGDLRAARRAPRLALPWRPVLLAARRPTMLATSSSAGVASTVGAWSTAGSVTAASGVSVRPSCRCRCGYCGIVGGNAERGGERFGDLGRGFGQ